MPKPRIFAPIMFSLTALLGVTILAATSTAQMRGGGGGASGFSRGVNVSFAGRPYSRSFGRDAIFLGDPFYSDYQVAPVTVPPSLSSFSRPLSPTPSRKQNPNR